MLDQEADMRNKIRVSVIVNRAPPDVFESFEPVETGTRLNALFEVEAAGLTALMYRLFLGQFA